MIGVTLASSDLPAALLAGRGEVDLDLDTLRLDGWLDATVAPGLKRASAGELAELAGINIPMRINGPLNTATLSYSLGEASGGGLPRLARLNQARVTAALTPVPLPTAGMTTAASTASTSKPAGK